MSSLCGVALALLDLLERPEGTVQCVSVVASELGVGALQRGVAVRLRLLNAVFIPPLDLLLCTVCNRVVAYETIVHTHFCAPSSTGCAETSSLTLRIACQYFSIHF